MGARRRTRKALVFRVYILDSLAFNFGMTKLNESLKSEIKVMTESLLVAQSRVNLRPAFENIEAQILENEKIQKFPVEDRQRQSMELYSLTKNSEFKESFINASKANGVKSQGLGFSMHNALHENKMLNH
jgi:hypothetical protein